MAGEAAHTADDKAPQCTSGGRDTFMAGEAVHTGRRQSRDVWGR